MRLLPVGAAVLAAATALVAAPGRADDRLPTDGTPRCGTVRGTTAAADDGQLRIGTFNVLHGQTTDGAETLLARIPIQAAELATSGADVIGVQEAMGDPMIVEEIGEALVARTGETWHWCWSRSNPHAPLTPDVDEGGGNPVDTVMVEGAGGFDEGVGVLSRYPIGDTGTRRLIPRTYEAPACLADPSDPMCALAAAFDARQVLWADVDVPGDDVIVFTTHIAHGLTPLSDTTKRLQIEQVLATIDERAGDDEWRFLVGDFNSDPTTDRYATVAAGGFVDTYRASGAAECRPADGAGGCTGDPDEGREAYGDSPHRRMHTRIDYVWAKPAAGCRLAVPNSRVIGETATKLPAPDPRFIWPSDHHGVVSQVVRSCP